MSIKAKSKKLYDEYKAGYIYYHSRKKGGFKRRLKTLASKISISETASLENKQAAMYLDHLAYWTDVDLNEHYQK